MGFVVGAVVVLVGEVGARRLGREPLRLAVVALGILGRQAAVDEHELHSHGPQAVELLPAGLAPDDHFAAQPLEHRHHREAHRRVSGGVLDDHVAGAHGPFASRLLDHEAGDAILHAAHRIHEFDLGEDLAGEARNATPQPHQRGPPDGFGDVVAHAQVGHAAEYILPARTDGPPGRGRPRKSLDAQRAPTLKC
jgi:hypothetical protein